MIAISKDLGGLTFRLLLRQEELPQTSLEIRDRVEEWCQNEQTFPTVQGLLQSQMSSAFIVKSEEFFISCQDCYIVV